MRAARRANTARRALSTLPTSASVTPVATNYAAYILSHVEAEAARSPAKAAFIEGTMGRSVLYLDFAYRVGAAARGFAAAGVTRGTVVGLHLPNSPEFVVSNSHINFSAARLLTEAT